MGAKLTVNKQMIQYSAEITGLHVCRDKTCCLSLWHVDMTRGSGHCVSRIAIVYIMCTRHGHQLDLRNPFTRVKAGDLDVWQVKALCLAGLIWQVSQLRTALGHQQSGTCLPVQRRLQQHRYPDQRLRSIFFRSKAFANSLERLYKGESKN